MESMKIEEHKEKKEARTSDSSHEHRVKQDEELVIEDHTEISKVEDRAFIKKLKFGVQVKATDFSNYSVHNEKFLNLCIVDQEKVDSNAFTKIVHNEAFTKKY